MIKNKVRFVFVLCALICVALISGNAHGSVVQYDGPAAVKYAGRWCNEINKTQYQDFRTKGGDCTNFVSQAIIDATSSDAFSCVKNIGVIGADNKTKGATYASQIGGVLSSNFCFKTVSLAEAKAGDIIVWGGKHAGILDGSQNVAAHSAFHCFSEGQRSLGDVVSQYA